jgi:hypothetical protein
MDTTTIRPPARCFMVVRSVYRAEDADKDSRDWAPARVKVELVARGCGTRMYTSKVCDTREEAVALCNAYVARRADRLVLS